MAELGYYYEDFPTSYLREALSTPQGLEDAKKWATSIYEAINNTFYKNK